MPARRGRVSAGRRPVHLVTPPAPGTVLTWRPGGAALGADKYEKPLSHVPVFEAALPPVMGINKLELQTTGFCVRFVRSTVRRS